MAEMPLFTLGSILEWTPSVLASILSACSKRCLLHVGRSIHAKILKPEGRLSDLYLQNHLLNFYAKCEKMECARQVFDGIHNRNTVSWTALISGYDQCRRGDLALEFFSLMLCQDPSSSPNQFTYASAFSACAKEELLAQGMQIQSHVLQRGYLSHLMVSNALIALYMGCGCVVEAELVFQELTEPDQVSWNSLVSGLSKNGFTQTALENFMRMRELDIRITSFALSAAVTACFEDVEVRENHGLAIKMGLDSDCFTGSALIRMYSKFKNMEDAFIVFQHLGFKDVASWNSLIEGYRGSHQGEKGLHVFVFFMESGLKTDEITMTEIIGICACLAMLDCGKQVHSLSVKNGLDGRIRVENSMIDMYAKCGSLEEGRKIFNQMKDRSVISWTAMMGGLAHHGRAEEVLQLFVEMKTEGVKPNKVTYTCILSACGHRGLVDLGQNLFDSMEIEPESDHYICMVQLLAGGGRFDEAEEFITSCPKEHQELLWQSFLVACKNLGKWERGLGVADNIMRAGLPTNPLTLVLLSNVFAAAERWEEVEKIREGMKEGGMKKEPGCSWIELDNTVLVFGI